jgi:hypothetical protein
VLRRNLVPAGRGHRVAAPEGAVFRGLEAGKWRRGGREAERRDGPPPVGRGGSGGEPRLAGFPREQLAPGKSQLAEDCTGI